MIIGEGNNMICDGIPYIRTCQFSAVLAMSVLHTPHHINAYELFPYSDECIYMWIVMIMVTEYEAGLNFFNLPVVCEVFGAISAIRGLLYYPEYLKFAETKNGDRILDSGCGIGGIFFATPAYKDLEIIALDLNPRMVWYADKIARIENFCSDINRYAIRGTSPRLPLKDESVDTVIDCHSLIYVPDKKKILNEYYRILKPGGCMVLVPHTDKKLRDAVEDTFKSYVSLGNDLTWFGNPPLKVFKD